MESGFLLVESWSSVRTMKFMVLALVSNAHHVWKTTPLTATCFFWIAHGKWRKCIARGFVHFRVRCRVVEPIPIVTVLILIDFCWFLLMPTTIIIIITIIMVMIMIVGTIIRLQSFFFFLSALLCHPGINAKNKGPLLTPSHPPTPRLNMREHLQRTCKH